MVGRVVQALLAQPLEVVPFPQQDRLGVQRVDLLKVAGFPRIAKPEQDRPQPGVVLDRL
jgi:hypothetical protein